MLESAVLTATGKFKTTDSDGFEGLRNKECAGKTGTDQTEAVIAEAGL
jgi:hypothetical protein